MEFYNEKMVEKLALYNKWVSETKEEIAKIPPESSVLWEVGSLIESFFPNQYNYMSWEREDKITANIPPMDLEDYEQLFNDIEELFNDNDFYMDIDYKMPSYITGQQFKFVKDNEDCKDLYITLSSTECKSIPTGKMVPERENVCTLINS